MSGTMAAQLVGYLFAPVITRLYTPEEGAELGLFLRIVAVGAALATARYEHALPILKSDSHSYRLYRLSFFVTVIVSLLSVAMLLVPIVGELSEEQLVFYGLIPIGIFFTAIYNLGTNWSIRMKQFQYITYARIANSILGSVTKVVFGIMQAGYVGLLTGTIIGLVSANLWFVRDFFRTNRFYKVPYRSARNWLLAKEHKEFPTINLPHALMDLARDLLLAVLILELFTKEDFGLYDHSYRMLRLPLVFVGVAIGQVFFQRCAEMYNNKEDITPLITKSIRTLTLLSIVPFTVIFFFGEELFSFVFGENWAGSGRYSEILAPMFMINFISSPISSLPMVLRKQKEFFFLAIFAAFLMVGCILIPPYFYNASIETTLWILSLSYSCYLVFVIFSIFYFVKKVKHDE
jgi:O-antigen/teichoic acid export membrane protein